MVWILRSICTFRRGGIPDEVASMCERGKDNYRLYVRFGDDARAPNANNLDNQANGTACVRPNEHRA